jgi:hypothetical protein
MTMAKNINPKMDKAAAEAQIALNEIIQRIRNDDGSGVRALEEILDWYKAHYMKAGYKRLGRIILGKWTNPSSPNPKTGQDDNNGQGQASGDGSAKDKFLKAIGDNG